MLNQNDKFEGFAQVINKDADEICAGIESQIHSTMHTQMAEIEKSAAAELERKLKAEENKVNTQINKRVCAIEAERKKLISSRREEICSEVLDAVRQKIERFCESDAYDGYLKRNLIKATDTLGVSVSVYVRKQDEQRVSGLICDIPLITQVKTDESIKLGGFIAEASDGSVRADCTLDSELQQQREWFILNSFRTNSDRL